MHKLSELIEKRLFRYLLSFLSGILLVISFPETGSAFYVSFIAWIPLLFVIQFIAKNKKSTHIFPHAYFTFLLYNIGCTWWIVNADMTAGILAFLANTLLMALTLTLCVWLIKRWNNKYFSLIVLSTWISFEFLHFHWDLSWTWLTLGNVFANVPEIILWYSVTGVFGGSIWILITNLLIFSKLNQRISTKRFTFTLLLLLVFPIGISFVIFSKETKGEKVPVCVLQPNEDPYKSKFIRSDSEQFSDLLNLANQSKHKNKIPQLFIAPETALLPNAAINEDEINQADFTLVIKNQMAAWKNSELFIGASTYRFFPTSNSFASQFIEEENTYYEKYNSSLLFSPGKDPQLVHKSKLVLGVEKIPFAKIFPFMNSLAITLGGTSGVLGVESETRIIKSKFGTFAPVNCYESIYGDFVRQQCKKGASFICIITNDGWWGDTPGYKQHFALARLRAIENNRWVVRSANTGFSGIINNLGQVKVKTKWWEKEGFSYNIEQISTQTIYTLFGDWLAYLIVVLWFLLFGLQFLNRKN